MYLLSVTLNALSPALEMEETFKGSMSKGSSSNIAFYIYSTFEVDSLCIMMHMCGA